MTRPESKQNSELAKDFLSWKEAIGDFMVSFNTCEYWVYRYIEELVPPKLARFLSAERLQKRSVAARAVIEDSGLSLSSDVGGIFDRLKDLADYRNILAHNSPMVEVREITQGEEKGEFRFDMHLSTPRGKRTGLDEIREKAEVARELASDMHELFAEVVLVRLKAQAQQLEQAK